MSRRGHRLPDALYNNSPFPPGPDDPLTLELAWVDIADALTMTAPAAGAIPLPTARRVRVELAAVAGPHVNYYGEDDVRFSQSTVLLLADNSADETALLAVTSNEAILGVFLQPDVLVDAPVATAQKAAGQRFDAPQDALGRLASALDLEPFELGLRGRPGHRVLFGGASALRHVVGPDGAGVKFTALGDLTRHWVVAIRLDLKRDWAWDELSYLTIKRDGVEVGRLWPRPSVGPEALRPPQRDRSDLVFLDAIDPKPAPGAFPAELSLSYEVAPVFRAAPAHVDPPQSFALRLPNRDFRRCRSPSSSPSASRNRITRAAPTTRGQAPARACYGSSSTSPFRTRTTPISVGCSPMLPIRR